MGAEWVSSVQECRLGGGEDTRLTNGSCQGEEDYLGSQRLASSEEAGWASDWTERGAGNGGIFAACLLLWCH